MCCIYPYGSIICAVFTHMFLSYHYMLYLFNVPLICAVFTHVFLSYVLHLLLTRSSHMCCIYSHVLIICAVFAVPVICAVLVLCVAGV